jgi:hypothetical protein
MSDPFDDKLLGDLDEAAPPPPLQQGFAVPMDRVEMRKRTKAITAMLQVFLKAGKTLRLYSSDHHFFSMFVGQFQDRINELLTSEDALTIEVTPRAMIWDGNVVFRAEEGRRESLPWKLHRDGVRLIQFIKGIERKEIQEFVTLLARETDATTSSGAELSVLFWEADFKHIRLAIAESFVEYTEEAERILTDVAEDLERLRQRFGIAGKRAQPGSYKPQARKGLDDVRRMTDDRITHGRLTGLGGLDGSAAGGGYGSNRRDAMPEAGRRGYVGTILVDEQTELPDVPVEAFDDNAMVRLYEDLHGLENVNAGFDEVGAILAEVVLTESSANELEVFLKHLDDALSPLLATGSIGSLNAILRPIALVARQQASEGTFRTAILRGFFVKLGREDRLALLAEALNVGWDEELRGELFTFVSVQHIDDVDAIFKLLRQVQDERPRDIITDALLLLTERDSTFFIPRLQSSSSFVAAAAVRALGKLGGPILMDYVAGAYTRSEPEVRVKVLQALRTDRSPRVSTLMQDALADPSSEVRLEALRYLATNRVQSSLSLLTETLRRKDFQSRAFDERRGWYIALGRLAGREALQAFTQQAEAGKESKAPATVEQVHLALLGIRATRATEAQAYLERFAETARGELRVIARRLITPVGSPADKREKQSGSHA